eukprot:TRINITY_DN7282_c0_g4_i1.p1 TRINITY_DN7282_c0_g4~~TRINITY_DN7282_c0_g4_i1.p1  ORF type:complete len:178 (-),score=59.55 TRINITY_DN7282_c0_g4_i1:112-645(-)
MRWGERRIYSSEKESSGAWNSNEVEQWMKENEMGREADLFKREGVDGIVLGLLQPRDLKELGILEMERRNGVIKSIVGLRDQHDNGKEEERPKAKDSTIDENDLICPITGEFMKDPVMAADGHNYERTAITKWLTTKLTSPITNERLKRKTVYPNHRLKAIINSHLENKAQTSSNSS